jgi:hypothetical protein
MRIIAAASLALAMMCALPAAAAPTDDIADALVAAARKPITADSLPADFARLTKFVRHDANGLILYTDGGPTDGYVRHAQAHFDPTPTIRKGVDMTPQFDVVIDLADQPGFTYEGLAAALEQRLGTPTAHSNQPGAIFRAWLLKDPAGRSVTLAHAQGSDGPDMTSIFQLIQNR